MLKKVLAGFGGREEKKDEEDKGPPPIGALFSLKGDRLCNVPTPTPIDFDGRLLEIAVAEDGLGLHIKLLNTSNNRAEAEEMAQRNHQTELVMRKKDYDAIQSEIDKLGLEAEAEDANLEEVTAEIARLYGVKGSHMRRIKQLEKKKELFVTFKIISGAAATIQPGVTTLVSFLEIPIVWCPYSLAAEVAGKQEQVTVSIKVKPPLGLSPESPASALLTLPVLEAIRKMLPKSLSNHQLLDHLLTGGGGQRQAASDFDGKVKNKKNILTIIKASSGYVFGCFVLDVYGSGGSWIPGNTENFLFGIGKPTKKDPCPTPLKLIKLEAGRNGIHITSCGIHMGDDSSLVAFCSHSSVENSMYKPAPGYEDVKIAGGWAGPAGSFNPEVMEVYELKEA